MKAGLTGLLVGANVALAALLGWLWVGPGGVRGIHWTPPAAVAPQLGSTAAFAIAQDDADTARYMAILDRPLFSTTRRPAPVAAGSGGPDPMEGMHLLGLFTGSDGGGVIVRVDGKTRRLRVNEAIGAWSLKEVRPQDAVFARGAETRVVALLRAKGLAALQGASTGGGAARQPVRNAAGYPVAPPPRARRTMEELARDAANKPRPAGPPLVPPPVPAAPAAAPAPAPKSAPGASSPFTIGGSR